MRAQLLGGALLLALAGCGAGDPCDGQSGACVTLTVQSATVTMVDTLSISAFGEIRTSTSTSESLPVRLALVPPATAVSGPSPISVMASLAGAVVGSGQTMVEVGPGHSSAVVDLSGFGDMSVNDGSMAPDLTTSLIRDMATCGDTTSAVHNCGSCNHDCTALPNIADPSAVSCVASKCVVGPAACRSGFAHCSSNPDDGCEADLSQTSHCGSCNACPIAAPLCASSGTNYTCTVNCVSPMPDRCNMSCVDLQSSTSNCKTCGHVCSYANAGASCSMGSCVIGSCTPGYADCKNGPADGCETYIQGTDANNCGGCGVVCKLGQICSSGNCKENQVTCASSGITCAQAGCYQAGRYSISAGGGIVVDLNNGRRLWTRISRGPNTHSPASTDCTTMALEGINAWRLPTYLELQSLQFMTGGLQGCPTCDPAIDQAAFPSADDGEHWSSDYVSAKCGYDTPNFCDGRNNYYEPATSSIPYYCVHDPLP